MLVKNLGQTRMLLLESFTHLTDEQLNQKPNFEKWSIAQILFHLYITEKETAVLILNSLKTGKKIVEGKLAFQADSPEKGKEVKDPLENFRSKAELIRLLNESRFQYVQAIFNEIHENLLEEKSIEHPTLGGISLRNLLDSIWMHEQWHIKQINEMKEELFKQR